MRLRRRKTRTGRSWDAGRWLIWWQSVSLGAEHWQPIQQEKIDVPSGKPGSFDIVVVKVAQVAGKLVTGGPLSDGIGRGTNLLVVQFYWDILFHCSRELLPSHPWPIEELDAPMRERMGGRSGRQRNKAPKEIPQRICRSVHHL